MISLVNGYCCNKRFAVLAPADAYLCNGDELELVDFAIVVGGHKVHRELQIEDEFGLRENPAFRFKEEAVKEIFI